MSENILKRVALDPVYLCDKESMAAFMKEHLVLPEYFGGNLDALSDVLSEICEETVFEVKVDDLVHFLPEEYPGRVLKVISHAAGENPHLHVYLTDPF